MTLKLFSATIAAMTIATAVTACDPGTGTADRSPSATGTASSAPSSSQRPSTPSPTADTYKLIDGVHLADGQASNGRYSVSRLQGLPTAASPLCQDSLLTTTTGFTSDPSSNTNSRLDQNAQEQATAVATAGLGKNASIDEDLDDPGVTAAFGAGYVQCKAGRVFLSYGQFSTYYTIDVVATTKPYAEIKSVEVDGERLVGDNLLATIRSGPLNLYVSGNDANADSFTMSAAQKVIAKTNATKVGKNIADTMANHLEP